MSGGCYRYIFDKDWEFVFQNIEQVKKAAGDAWFHGYEDVARALRSWYNDYKDDPAYTWTFEGDIEDQDFSPEQERLEEEWELLCPVVKGLSWWLAGDTGEERFRETVREWKNSWRPSVQGIEIEDQDVKILVDGRGEKKTVVPGRYYTKGCSGKGQITFPTEVTDMTWEEAEEIQSFLDRKLFGWICQGTKIRGIGDE